MVKQEKVLEERLKRSQEEFERTLQQKDIKIQSELDLKNQEIVALQHKLDLAEMQSR